MAANGVLTDIDGAGGSDRGGAIMTVEGGVFRVFPFDCAVGVVRGTDACSLSAAAEMPKSPCKLFGFGSTFAGIGNGAVTPTQLGLTAVNPFAGDTDAVGGADCLPTSTL